MTCRGGVGGAAVADRDTTVYERWEPMRTHLLDLEWVVARLDRLALPAGSKTDANDAAARQLFQLRLGAGLELIDNVFRQDFQVPFHLGLQCVLAVRMGGAGQFNSDAC